MIIILNINIKLANITCILFEYHKTLGQSRSSVLLNNLVRSNSFYLYYRTCNIIDINYACYVRIILDSSEAILALNSINFTMYSVSLRYVTRCY